jgi:hypothetical protein
LAIIETDANQLERSDSTVTDILSIYLNDLFSS